MDSEQQKNKSNKQMNLEHNKEWKPKGVWYSTEYRTVINQKTCDGDIYFPSRLEYTVFQCLIQSFDSNTYRIQIHPKIKTGSKHWNIDFGIIATKDSSERTLAALVNRVSNRNFKNLQCCYVEVKGYQDSNFVDKMGHWMIECPNIASTIILVSKSTSAFGVLNRDKSGITTKPIVGLDLFKYWVSEIQSTIKEN